MFKEDVDVFLDDFAEAVLWDGVEIQAIYTSAYERAGIGELGMAASSPALTMPTALVPVDPVGQLVGVRGVRYSVAEHQPDGTGMSLLFLERA